MSLSVIREGGRQTIVTGRGRRRTANTQGGVAGQTLKAIFPP